MTLGSHQTAIGRDQARFTPRWIVEALGRFDTDAATGDPRPFDIGANRNITERENSLLMDWRDFGRVWLNPPFDSRIVGRFVSRMLGHARGTMLLHARTETAWFAPIWHRAHALLFLHGRVNFLNSDGSPILIPDKRRHGRLRAASSGAPVVLSAFGPGDMETLAFCGLAGKFVPLIVPRQVLAAFAGTWAEAVAALAPDGDFHLDEIYRRIADHPVARRNRHAKAKVRQIVQGELFERVGRGRYRKAGTA